jgi:hypothetical protein
MLTISLTHTKIMKKKVAKWGSPNKYSKLTKKNSSKHDSLPRWRRGVRGPCCRRQTPSGRTRSRPLSACARDCLHPEKKYHLSKSGLTNPRLTYPRLTYPRLTYLRLTYPRLTNPRLTNPRLTNPRLTEPRLTNPRLTNPR